MAEIVDDPYVLFYDQGPGTVELTDEEKKLIAEASQADAFYNGATTNSQETTAQNQSAAETQRLLSQNGGAAGTPVGAATESVFDPTYGGTLPPTASATGSPIIPASVYSNAVSGSLLNLAPGVTANNLLRFLSLPSPAQSYQQALENPLLNFDSYTYNLSLHLLSESQFNAIIENPDASYIPQNVIVASGGRRNSTFRRNQFFNEDFYFENFQMDTIVNTTVVNRNSNMIKCSFVIIEPVGFTFINRLIDAVSTMGGSNYLRQPYLLQIDFFGYANGTDANGPIPNMSKYIPITLVSMKSKITSKGTEYHVEAVPYNHQALNAAIITSPADFQVKAKTVADFLGTGQSYDQLTTAYINSQRDQAALESLQESIRKGELTGDDLSTAQEYIKTAASTSGQFSRRGFTDALNEYLAGLANKNGQIFYPNTYRVKFDPEIGNSNIIPNSAKPNNVANAASGDKSKTDTAAAGGRPVGYVDFQSGVFNVKKGTAIDKLIDYAVRNSDYIRNQLADNTSDTGKDISSFQLKLGNSLKWYRIVPKIKIGLYDPARKQYAYDITYYVKTWAVNTKHPYAPQGRTPGYVKQYDYIYTGKNKDVLDVSIDFDMLYYNQLTGYRNKMREGESGSGLQNRNPDTPGAGPNIVPTDSLQPVPTNFVSNDYRTTARTGPSQSAAVSGGDVQRDIMLSSRGDMVNIKVKILGDPQLIKQDDLFYGQNVGGSFSQLTPNGSLYYDNGELYVFVNFQSPTDYDETIGLAVPQLSDYQYSAFSGIYKIIKVDNVFSRGKFEQTLDLVRLPISDNLRNLQTNARSRADNYTNFGLGQLASLPYARFTGPRILINALPNGGQLVNAGLATASGAGTGILGSVLNQAISKAAGMITDKIASIFKTPTFSTNPKDYEVYKATETQYGAFGEEPTGGGAATSAATDNSNDLLVSDNPLENLETDGLGEALAYEDLPPNLDGFEVGDVDLTADIEIPEDITDFFG